MFNLDSKIAIVTGASRGIGRSIARTLAQAGAHSVCVSRTLEDIQQVARDITNSGLKASAYACDVSQYEQIEDCVKDTVAAHGRIDILVSNAGVTRDTLILRMSQDQWDHVLNINLKGAFNGIKAVFRTMMKQRSGRIIAISSVVGLTGNTGQANYAASKAGLIGLVKSTAKELASRGITANCIAPGYIDTDMTQDLPEEIRNDLKKQIPLGKIGQPEDIASMALFLASDESGYITGQTFTVDGGMVMS